MQHELHDFIAQSQRVIEDEYQRIQRRATEDPGTAGDQGEENWATLLRSWLPSYFKIVTKGRILSASGEASPQVDILILSPSYPELLLDKKMYLAGGVVAAFECKITLKAEHIRSAVETCRFIKSQTPQCFGTPYKELNASPIYGLLAHSHCWKAERSTPNANTTQTLVDADAKAVKHPIEALDCLCIADLATWLCFKFTGLPIEPTVPGARVPAHGYLCKTANGPAQSEFFSPVGALLSAVYNRLAFTFTEMRDLCEYFRQVDIFGTGYGHTREWSLEIYSPSVQERLAKEPYTSKGRYSEWSESFF